MRALLLAAGFGTRLKPLTDKIPKAMVPINGKPCLEYHLESLRDKGITEFAINTHYLPEKIKEYFGDGSKWGVSIRYSFEEPEILGTAGALNNFRDFFNEDFIVVYADVFANFQLSKILKVHQKNKGIATILLDDQRPMEGKGVVEFNGEKVTRFVEKPLEIIPNALINSGFYILTPEVLKSIPLGFSDFGKDILPKLTLRGEVFCTKHEGYIFDIGTLDDLKKAEDYFRKFATSINPSKE